MITCLHSIFNPSETKSLTDNLMVIKVMFHSLYNLIILVPLTGDQDYISRLCQHTSCTDGLSTVHDTDYATALFVIKSCKHVIDDSLRILEPGIITCDDHAITISDCLLRHQGTLSTVSISTSTTYGPALSPMLKYLIDSLQHIDQSIGRMCIVHYSSHTLWRTDTLKTPVHRLHGTQLHKSLIG